MYLDNITPRGKTFGSEIEAVDAKREILQDEVPVCGNLEIALVSVALAEEFATGRDAGSLGIAHFEMQFAAEALCASRDSDKQV